MKFKWRKWNRAIHRDLGYFFFGVTIIYAISGIAINHLRDWNPSYIINQYPLEVDIPSNKADINEEIVKEILSANKLSEYKKYYFPSKEKIKIFFEKGSLLIELGSGVGMVETIKKRPVFYQVRYLHYNPHKWWTIFSDVYGGALILMAITGLFIIRGKNGIKGRGAWLTITGLLIPILFLLFF